jgi:hypothetical protein
MLSWYQGVSLDQLEYLREAGLDSIDRVKLCQRACTIVECANTNKLFDVGEGGSDEFLDDADFEEPGSVEAPEKATKDLADGSIPPSPSGDNFLLTARTGDATPFERADMPTAP